MSEEHPLQARLLREQIGLLAQNVRALVISLLITATVTASLLWANGQPVSRILGWLVITLIVILGRGAMIQRFRLRTAAGDAPENWSRMFVLAAALSGACWGSLGMLFYTPDDPLNLAAVTIIVTTMLVNATQSLGPYFPAHLSFALPCALPLVLQFLASDNAAIVRLGVLGVLVVIMSELYSLRIARSIKNALQLRFENESLAGQLRIEKERAEAASVAKTRFLATASHDLRQPVHAMNLFVPALKALSNRPEISPPIVSGIADRLQSALDTMAQLLNRLLDLSRLDAGAMQPRPGPTALQPLLRKVCDEVTQQARNKGLRLRVRDGGLAVHADPAVLYTILSNLAGNAVRYTERGGVLLAARRRGERVRIEVWDTGVGIGASDLPHVTEEFFQVEGTPRDASQSRGFGLGLAIVKRSADLLGSPLFCRSRPGHGSVFAVELPAVALISSDAAAARDAGPHPSRVVLVVDDDEQILSAMGLLLRSWGHEVLVARTQQEALACAASVDAPPQVALVDMHLSADEDGVQVIAALRGRLGADLRAAVITGDTSPDVMAQIRAAGILTLHKPVAPGALRHFIEAAPAVP